MSDDAFHEDLGAYALGTLGMRDRDALDEHLPSCAACQAQLREFAMLPRLLAATTAADVLSASAPLPDLMPPAFAAQGARRRARRRMLAIAASVALVAGAGGVAALTREPAPPARLFAENVDAASHVRAKVSYAAAEGGTTVWLTLEGVPSGEHCELIAVGTGNRREVAATWQASYAGEATARGMTALPIDAITGFEVATTDGRHLVWVTAAAPS